MRVARPAFAGGALVGRGGAARKLPVSEQRWSLVVCPAAAYLSHRLLARISTLQAQ